MRYKVLLRYILTIIISLAISQIALSKSKEHPYLRDGISFSIAADWKVTADDSIGDKAYYFTAERTGNQATGLITVTWVNKDEDPEKMMAIHQRSMKSANIYRNPGIEFTLIKSDSFAGLQVKSCRYLTFVKEQKLDGNIYCFNAAQKTITIFFQSGFNDKEVNQKAFELFKQTFSCREK